MEKFSNISKISFFNLLMDTKINTSVGSRFITTMLSLNKQNKILIGNDLGQVMVWHSDTYSLYKTIQVSKRSITSLTKVSGLNRVLVTAFNSYLTLMDSISFASIWRFHCQYPVLCSRGILNTFVNVSSLGKVNFFTVEPFEPVNELSTGNCSIAEFEFCVVSRVIIFACKDKKSLVFSLDSYEKLACNVHRSAVLTVCVSYLSRVYATGEADGLISIFNLGDVKVLLLSVENRVSITQLKFINKGKDLVSVDKSNKIAIRDLENLSTKKEFQLLNLGMKTFQLLDKKTKISCLFEDGSVLIAQLSNLKVVGEIYNIFKDTYTFYSTPKNSHILIYDTFGSLILWNRSEGKGFTRLFIKKDLKISKINITQKSIVVSINNLSLLVFKLKKLA